MTTPQEKPKPNSCDGYYSSTEVTIGTWGTLLGAIGGALLSRRNVKKATTGRTIGYVAGFGILGGTLLGTLAVVVNQLKSPPSTNI